MHPDRVLTNTGAGPGDVLVLTKPLGVGVLSAAFKQGRLVKTGYRALMDTTTRLNTLGSKLIDQPGVHAVTDVTGFGLLGHALEMARGGGVRIQITDRPPTLAGVDRLMAEGVRTGASTRNWAAYGDHVNGVADGVLRDLLTDPQTSGGLLISVAEAELTSLQALARLNGTSAMVVGRVVDGAPGVDVVTL